MPLRPTAMNTAENVKHIVAVVAVNSDPSQNSQLNKDERLSHIKKEKSRDAARSRRGRENCQFYALATLLPVPEETSSQLDKASIIRLTMSYLQLRKFSSLSSLTKFLPSHAKLMQDDNSQIVDSQLSMTLQSLDGFLIILNQKGRCLYVSNTISEDLGLAQVDVIGSNILNFVYSADHEELNDHLNSRCCEESKKKFCQSILISKDLNKCCCSFFVRIKSTQPRRSLGMKSSGYKVVHLTGYVVNKELGSFELENSSDEEANKDVDTRIGFAGVGRVLSHNPLVFAPNEPVFISKIDRSMLITFCDEQITKHAEYDPDEVKGCTIYQFIHTSDLIKIRTCHLEILKKGHIVTPFYRWLLKNGTFIWVQSRCALIQEKHQYNEEESYVWVTYVISHDRDDIPVNTNVKPMNSASIIDEISKSSARDDLTVGSKSQTPSRVQADDPQQPKLLGTPSSPSMVKETPACVKPENTTHSKLIKQNPEKTNLKRFHSLETVCKSELMDDIPMKAQKREFTDNINGVERMPTSILPSSYDVQKVQGKSEDVLDVHSTMWGNPPNREAVNHSDLYTTVIHHHYPYGIDPNLLNSNPIFAKMLTTNYVTYESLFQREAYILPSPAVNIFTPVLGAIPQLIPAQPAKLNYCPTSVASIIDELKKDPMREVNPPNKVILSRSHIPSSDSSQSPGAKSHDSTSPKSVVTVPNSSPIFTFPSVSSLLRPLGDLEGHASGAPIFFHPVNLTQKVNTLNTLPI